MKKILSLALFLAITCGIAGGALAYVNSITEPIIEEQKINKIKETLVQIYPDVDDFNEVTLDSHLEGISNVYKAGDIGYIYVSSQMGYKDMITAMVGISNGGVIDKVVVTYFNDTPGIGDKILEDSFINAYDGKKQDDSLDIMAGVTYSSQALNTAIENALMDFNNNFGGNK